MVRRGQVGFVWVRFVMAGKVRRGQVGFVWVWFVMAGRARHGAVWQGALR